MAFQKRFENIHLTGNEKNLQAPSHVRKIPCLAKISENLCQKLSFFSGALIQVFKHPL